MNLFLGCCDVNAQDSPQNKMQHDVLIQQGRNTMSGEKIEFWSNSVLTVFVLVEWNEMWLCCPENDHFQYVRPVTPIK